jgi:hypothetical protein
MESFAIAKDLPGRKLRTDDPQMAMRFLRQMESCKFLQDLPGRKLRTKKTTDRKEKVVDNSQQQNHPPGQEPVKRFGPAVQEVYEKIAKKAERAKRTPEELVGNIVVGTRHRQDLGDIAALAKSIKKLGLLQPIVVTPDRCLIAGRRRLEAVRELGWERAPIHVVDGMDVALKALRAEHDENTCRKPFTPSEAVARRNGIYRSVPKRDLVGAVMSIMHHNRLHIAKALPETETLIKELRAFTAKITTAGSEKFENDWRINPHDDIVLALALALEFDRSLKNFNPDAFYF